MVYFCCLFFHVVARTSLFGSLVRRGLRLTDFYCLILSRLLANMQLRLDTLSSSHNYFCGNTKIYCFLEFGKARSSADRFLLLILSRLLANMQLRLDTLSSSHNYFCGNTKIYCFCAQIDFFGLELQHCESQKADTFCITMVDYKITFSKNISFDDPQNGIIFHVENRCRM